MVPRETVVGILSPSFAMRQNIASQLQELHFPCTIVEADRYGPEAGDRVIRNFAEAGAQIIFVDLEDRIAGLRTLQHIHAAISDAWLFVTAEAGEPELIIETMRAGAREFFLKPVPSGSLSQALERYSAEKRHFAGQIRRGHIYCVTAPKEGCGTTTAAINLASCMASSHDIRVCLIDLNSPIGDAAEFLNLKPKFTVSDALANTPRLDVVLLETLVSHAHGVAVLPGVREFTPGSIFTPNALAHLLDIASQTYTHSVVDLSAQLDGEQLKIIAEHSDSILVILTPELPTLWRADRLLNLYRKAGAEDKIRLVMNRTSKKYVITEKEIQRILHRRVFWNIPNDYAASIQAVNSGKPLVAVNHSGLASSYFGLAETLTGISLRKKRGFLF